MNDFKVPWSELVYILVKLQVVFVLNYVANCECFVVIKVILRNCGC